jgi:hypothetical protein
MDTHTHTYIHTRTLLVIHTHIHKIHTHIYRHTNTRIRMPCDRWWGTLMKDTHTHTLMNINEAHTHTHTHTPCDRCKVGYFNESITNITLNEERQNITNEGRCVRILCIAEIAAFQPALSYGPARDLYQTLGLMSLDGAYFSKQKFRFIKKKCN